ncbi:hypothetical protein [Roseibium aggregatum]|uniref:Uncharacterized protein n=1 Tax=Roseibium aggregatum TaxID=187304 RepID=A0A926NVI7_9HYPH|nr:hypothetical protein [Roseibium aggregatum]MBD1544890.1 hypothetical protein [Roseibium aggregatum]
MNWKRGFIRTWLVLSTVWVALVFVQLDLIAAAKGVLEGKATVLETLKGVTFDDLIPSENKRPENPFEVELLNRQADAILNARKRRLFHIFKVAFLPPLGFLAAGLCVSWIIRGFRSETPKQLD